MAIQPGRRCTSRSIAAFGAAGAVWSITLCSGPVGHDCGPGRQGLDDEARGHPPVAVSGTPKPGAAQRGRQGPRTVRRASADGGAWRREGSPIVYTGLAVR